MKAALEEGKSIFLQISESIEDDILTEIISEEELIPSTNQIAKHYLINPATAAKGVNLLVDDGIIYKKRGIGMCVKTGARDIILQKRKKSFYDNFILSLIKEADKLGISKTDLINMIERDEQHEQ
ncbi:MAG: GntR family transcriptional regulator [Bacillota bacterium]|nr:GntR family transcriptional regulator [Bacillota bacterium]